MDIGVVRGFPHFAIWVRRGKCPAKAEISDCDAISGVDAMMNKSFFQGERGTAILKVLLKDGERVWDSNIQPVGDHSQCADERETGRRQIVRRSTQEDGTATVVYLANSTRFRVQWTRCAWGPLVVPDVSVVPGAHTPPAGLARRCQGPRGGVRGGFATCSGARSSPPPAAASHCSPETRKRPITVITNAICGRPEQRTNGIMGGCDIILSQGPIFSGVFD